MKKIPAVVLAVFALLVVGKFWLSAHDRAIRANERHALGDRHDDSTVARLAYESRVMQTRLLRERDSTARVIARQRNLIDRLNVNRKPLTDTIYVQQELDARDSLIASLLSGRAQDSLQLLFWRAQVEARDSLIPRLTQSRDAWRKSAEKPSHTITDLIGAGLVGYGAAKENTTVVAAGGSLIVVPRVLDGVKKLLDFNHDH